MQDKNKGARVPVSGPGRPLVFLSVVASYSHTNLAAWLLRAYAERAGFLWQEVEVTRNEALAAALARLVRLQPAVLAATFYLFNRDFLLALLVRFKTLCPQCRIVAGGPEFLGDNRAFIERYPFIDAVIRGEGELAFAEWLRRLERPETWAGIPGFCGRIGRRYVDNGSAEMVRRLDDIPSPYMAGLAGCRKPFILLETSRGCANLCAFCTSAGVPVRAVSLERVRRDLKLIAASGIPEVRLVDRTFNDRPARCLPLLRMFRDEFKALRFHLEIDPARLTPAILRELAAAGPGRFHLESGVQTLKPEVLRGLERRATAGRSLAGVEQLCRLRKLDVHVDLIAGLPGATLADVFRDLKTLVPLNPGEIQLEVLKVLPGTRLSRARDRLGLTASPEPPYEALQTPTMSAGDLETARALGNLVDWFFNARELREVVLLAAGMLPCFWEELAVACVDNVSSPFAPSLENRFRWLNDFFRGRPPALNHALHYAWMKHGFSAQHGICAASVWKGEIPPNAKLVEGAAAAFSARRFLVPLAQPTLFAYGREKRAVAIYRLCDG
jgi:radical SAM superfamily enzyme YgiQ (UPF0313 family)